MQLNKVVIGVRFSKKSFKLSSLSGIVIDDILALRETNKRFGSNFLNKFSSDLDPSNLHVKFLDDKGIYSLIIQPDQIAYIKSADTDTASVNVEQTIKDFEILWKTANKILKFDDIRRIGLVGEFHIKAKSETSAPNQLIDALLNIEAPKFSGHFNLRYEDRDLGLDGDKNTADYWNTLYSFYPSELDVDFPVKGRINANMDVQKFYNPAKSEPLRELRVIKDKFTEKKAKFKELNKTLGLVD